jgi:YidC/Oxa1 family membrane protein insertase
MHIFDAVSRFLGTVLSWFYAVVPNTGIAIILLTIAVRLILFPLTAKQAKSMIQMQRMQPELKKLQAKFKNDRQKLGEETMKFYKENQVNPWSGCLPLLLQMPIWIALVQTLRHIQDFIPVNSTMFHSICGSATTAAQCKNPSLDFFGMDLTKSASNAGGMPGALPYYVLVALLVGIMFVQQRQMMRGQTQINPQMQTMTRVMPVVFGALSFIYPAGVALYFLVSSMWQIGQQELVFRTFGTAADPVKKKATLDVASKELVADGDTAVEVQDKPERKGMFANLRAQMQQAQGTAGSNGKATNGKATNGKTPAGDAAASKATGARSASSKATGAKQGSATSGAKSPSKATGAKQGNASSSASKPSNQSNRRKNNRKRKR